jgi:TrmH family RNA methyltransferase
VESISSRDNSVIKEVRKLKERKHREEKRQFLVEGLRFVSEALGSDFEVSCLFLSEEMAERWGTLGIEGKARKSAKTYILTERVFREISFTEHPQGIAAVVELKERAPEKKEGFYILADRVQDPGNLGTIIRSAHASGALGVMLTKGTVDVYNDKVLRSTMGSIFHVPVIEDRDLGYLKALRGEGFRLVVSSLETDYDFFQADLTGRVIIAVGNEGAGISRELMDMADVRVKIPMPGGAESLNVSAAASIMMFEVVRQKILQVDNDGK